MSREFIENTNKEMRSNKSMNTETKQLIEQLSFSQYGEECNHIKVSELIKIKDECIARVENSGSEGIYCEIARWNPKTQKYQRFAFAKFLGGEILDWDYKTCAKNVTEYLNDAWEICEDEPIIHHMEDWS